MVSRRSRFGKIFFSCSNFPDCDVIISDLDKLSDKYPSHSKTAYVKKPSRFAKKGAKKEKAPAKSAKKKGGKGKAPTQTPKKLSKELEAIVEEKSLTRPEVVKKVWDYIKKHKLQDPKNKRLIRPDAKLAKLFGSKESVDMMQLSRLLTPHLK